MIYFYAIQLWAETPSQKTSKSPWNDRLKIAVLQMALDREGFSPGCIDGRKGPKTDQALKWLEQSQQSLDLSSESWAEWNMPPNFLMDLAPLPKSWLARSKLASLSYETLLEKLAEKFHVTEEFLQFLNPNIQDWTKLKEGDCLKIPVLSPKRLPPADHLELSLSDKIVLVYDERDQVIASYPCSIAMRKEKRPLGKLEVHVLVSNPDYLFDPALFTEIPETATTQSKLVISPGPNNPVGEMWIGLNLKGYGIHGTPWPEDIGKTESHGCFRLTNWDAKRLAKMLRIGTPVYIKE